MSNGIRIRTSDGRFVSNREVVAKATAEMQPALQLRFAGALDAPHLWDSRGAAAGFVKACKDACAKAHQVCFFITHRYRFERTRNQRGFA